MNNFFKKHKKLCSLLLSLAIFLNMQYPYIGVLADEVVTTNGNVASMTTPDTLTNNNTQIPQNASGNNTTIMPPPSNYINRESNDATFALILNDGSESGIDISTAENFAKQVITVNSSLALKVTKVLETGQAVGSKVKIQLPNMPLDYETFVGVV